MLSAGILFAQDSGNKRPTFSVYGCLFLFMIAYVRQSCKGNKLFLMCRMHIPIFPVSYGKSINGIVLPPHKIGRRMYISTSG